LCVWHFGIVENYKDVVWFCVQWHRIANIKTRGQFLRICKEYTERRRKVHTEEKYIERRRKVYREEEKCT